MARRKKAENEVEVPAAPYDEPPCPIELAEQRRQRAYPISFALKREITMSHNRGTVILIMSEPELRLAKKVRDICFNSPDFSSFMEALDAEGIQAKPNMRRDKETKELCFLSLSFAVGKVSVPCSRIGIKYDLTREDPRNPAEDDIPDLLRRRTLVLKEQHERSKYTKTVIDAINDAYHDMPGAGQVILRLREQGFNLTPCKSKISIYGSMTAVDDIEIEKDGDVVLASETKTNLFRIRPGKQAYSPERDLEFFMMPIPEKTDAIEPECSF